MLNHRSRSLPKVRTIIMPSSLKKQNIFSVNVRRVSKAVDRNLCDDPEECQFEQIEIRISRLEVNANTLHRDLCESRRGVVKEIF